MNYIQSKNQSFKYKIWKKDLQKLVSKFSGKASANISTQKKGFFLAGSRINRFAAKTWGSCQIIDFDNTDYQINNNNCFKYYVFSDEVMLKKSLSHQLLIISWSVNFHRRINWTHNFYNFSYSAYCWLLRRTI